MLSLDFCVSLEFGLLVVSARTWGDITGVGSLSQLLVASEPVDLFDLLLGEVGVVGSRA